MTTNSKRGGNTLELIRRCHSDSGDFSLDIFDTVENSEKAQRNNSFCSILLEMKSLLLIFLAFVALSSSQNVCGDCEAIVSIADKWLVNNASMEQIETYLKSICFLVPGLATPVSLYAFEFFHITFNLLFQCERIVNGNFNEFIERIQKNDKPKQICSYYGLCDPTPEMAPPPLEVKPVVPPSVEGPSCGLCQTVVGMIVGWLAQNETVNDIIERLNYICTYLPSEYSTTVNNECESNV